MTLDRSILLRYIDGPAKFDKILASLTPIPGESPSPSFETEEGLLSQLENSRRTDFTTLFYIRRLESTDHERSFVLERERFHFKSDL